MRYYRNSDESLRELERRASQGDSIAALRWLDQAERSGVLGDGKPVEHVIESPWGRLGFVALNEGQVVVWAGDAYVHVEVRQKGHEAFYSSVKLPPITVDGEAWKGSAEFLWRELGDQTPDAVQSIGDGYQTRTWIDKPIPEDLSGGTFRRGTFQPLRIDTFENRVTRGRRAGMVSQGPQRANLFHFGPAGERPYGPPRHSRGARREQAIAELRAARERNELLASALQSDMTLFVNEWLAAHPEVLHRARLDRFARDLVADRNHVRRAAQALETAQAKLAEKIIESFRIR